MVLLRLDRIKSRGLSTVRDSPGESRSPHGSRHRTLKICEGPGAAGSLLEGDPADRAKGCEVLLRRLVGPLTLTDPSDHAAFDDWVASLRPGLLEGLVPIQVLASPAGFEPALPA
jgi:hypothetical protein